MDDTCVNRNSEEWRPVVGYEGRYEVSDQGRVKRIAGGKGVKRPILSPGVATIGYRMVTLSLGTIPTRRKHYVHRLVAEAFIGRPPAGSVVNHIDADKLNNTPANLEFVTQLQNVRHAKDHDLFAKGEALPGAKLTEQDVREIRAVRGYVTTRRLGELYGVENGIISDIQNGKRWKHVR